MKKSPLISIVLPTYNGARYLHLAVESCLRQTFTDWELILVDDGSTDSTPEIIADLARKDSRIRGLRNVTNQRIPASLNRGFAAAQGKYFTWTSDDNLYAEDALAVMVDLLETQPEVGLVYAGYSYIDENGAWLSDSPARGPEYLAVRCVVNCCFLYRRTLHEKLGGYRENLAFVDDWDFWLRAAANFRLRPIPKNLYYFRLHPNSLGVSKADAAAAAAKQLLDSSLPSMQWAEAHTGVAAFLLLADRARGRGEREASKRWFWKAFRLGPLITFRNRPKQTLKAFLGTTASGAFGGVIRELRACLKSSN